jgi:hypothetical protein
MTGAVERRPRRAPGPAARAALAGRRCPVAIACCCRRPSVRAAGGGGAVCFILIVTVCSSNLRHQLACPSWHHDQLRSQILITKLGIGGVRPGYVFFNKVAIVKQFLEF